jgi:hypothetical protein
MEKKTGDYIRERGVQFVTDIISAVEREQAPNRMGDDTLKVRARAILDHYEASAMKKPCTPAELRMILFVVEDLRNEFNKNG